MPSFVIQGGKSIDVPSAREIADLIQAEAREKARGIKPIRIARPGPATAASTLFMVDAAPESGYLWNLKLISVQLAAAGTLLTYITSSAPSTSSTPLRLIANNTTSNANQVITFSSSQVILYPDEGVYLSATQNINAVFLTAAEVPAEMYAKIYD